MARDAHGARARQRRQLKIMLRVTTLKGSSEVRLQLEGRLAGPWVREAEESWKGAQSAGWEQEVVVDLREVDYVDSAGEQLLRAMHRRGARLLAGSPMMAHLVGEIVGTPEETSSGRGRKNRQRQSGVLP